jgi:hypothetical protein
MPITKPSQAKHSEQNILNDSFDEEAGVSTIQPLGFDGVNIQRMTADALALKVTVDGTVTYLGISAPGTAQATAKWQCKKIDATTGTIITWADGDANFDNVATDLTSLSYS